MLLSLKRLLYFRNKIPDIHTPKTQKIYGKRLSEICIVLLVS